MSRWQPTPDERRAYQRDAQARITGLDVDERWALVARLGVQYRAELEQLTDTALRLGALVTEVLGRPLPSPVNLALLAHAADAEHIPGWIHRRRLELGAGLPLGELEPPPATLPPPVA